MAQALTPLSASFLCLGGRLVLPVILLIFGLGYIFEFFSYLKGRWAWAIALFVCCVGLLDLYYNQDVFNRMATHPNLPQAGFMERIAYNLNAPSPGGIVGSVMNSVFSAISAARGPPLFSLLYTSLGLIS